MGIDPNAVGAVLGSTALSWTSRDAMIYALGVGAGVNELAFTTENSHGIEHTVLPTYGVVVAQPPVDLRLLGEIDTGRVLHGAQAIPLHATIPTDGTVEVCSLIADIQDKGPGKPAVIAVEREATDAATGDKLATCHSTIVYRGGGGFGGQRGEPVGTVSFPQRAPDHHVMQHIDEKQALLYRLSGDRNRLHSDPWFARERAGFPRPILHGLCTYGYAGRALLNSTCGGDAARFGGMQARFSSPVVPGQTLTTSIWKTDGGAVFRTTASPDDRLVLDQGTFQFASWLRVTEDARHLLPARWPNRDRSALREPLGSTNTETDQGERYDGNL